MKLTCYQYLAKPLNRVARLSKLSKAHLTLCFGLLLLQPLADSLSMSMGHVVDISEFIAVIDTLLAEIMGASLLGLLILNPLVIDQFWRLFNLNSTFCNLLALSYALSALSVVVPKSLEYTAHGCRAPPLQA
ncbi:hypothetical protein FH971_01000 [Shewanella polaris]|uniref:Uncharacterized protein n=1 Tax=Shewanella polaris TaxID=2588449 RepID=A0A4Y5YAH3_9GAMM|nr:hypothetical protein FH971_01000 [Shewanella polaris]